MGCGGSKQADVDATSIDSIDVTLSEDARYEQMKSVVKEWVFRKVPPERKMARLAEAEEKLRRLLTDSEAKFGAEDSTTMLLLYGFNQALEDAQKYKDQEPVLRRLLAYWKAGNDLDIGMASCAGSFESTTWRVESPTVRAR